MYGFPLAISCCVKISNIPTKFVKYIDVPLFKAVTVTVCCLEWAGTLEGDKNNMGRCTRGRVNKPFSTIIYFLICFN